MAWAMPTRWIIPPENCFIFLSLTSESATSSSRLSIRFFAALGSIHCNAAIYLKNCLGE